MAMLRAKQIKLSAAGDLLIGGVGGAGTVLTKGTAGHVLKATAGGLEYNTLAATEIVRGESTVDADLTAIETEVGSIETAVGLESDGTLAAFADTNYLDAVTSIKGGLTTLDEALGELASDVADLTGLNALRFKGTISGAASAAELAGMNLVQGDVVRIITTGAVDFAETGISVNVGDFIAHAGTTNVGSPEEPEYQTVWVKFDNTDPTVSGTTNRVAVSGNAHAGWEIDIDEAYAGQASITTVGTIGTGTWEGTTIAQGFGGTGITTVTGSEDEHKALVVGSTGALEYAYVGALRDADGVAAVTINANGKLEATEATVAGDGDAVIATKGYVDGLISGLESGLSIKTDEDFTVGAAPGANYSVTLTSTPVGSVSVFFNGLKLKTSEYTVTGTTVALIDATLGYAAEEGDVISVSYMAEPVI